MTKDDNAHAISAIEVEGFKSFADKSRLEIRPLTLLAGANSSGKSSILQPLLLLKQTLEASYDPGPLLLHDSHVKFTSASQLLTKLAGRPTAEEFRITIETNENKSVTDIFRKAASGEGFDLVRMEVSTGQDAYSLAPGMSSNKVEKVIEKLVAPRIWKMLHETFKEWEVQRNRCFYEIGTKRETKEGRAFPIIGSPLADFNGLLRSIVHVPGLRGNPTRTYKTTAIGENFQGTFENYAASVIASWQRADEKRIKRLNKVLEEVGLTWKVRAKPVDATQVELLVGRLPRSVRGGASDLVNIVDVGFGLSQSLPAIVALLVARPGQMVYLEQPEIHLHPRAQEALTYVLAEAANSDVRVVVETHSPTILLSTQALVAEGRLSSEKVKLHWFTRDSRGATKVESADIDQLGAYGEWPEDFGDVRASVENRYLDAVEVRALGPRKNAKSKKK